MALLLALVTLAVFWPVTRAGFVNYDDPDYIYNNPRVQQGLTSQNAGWAFTTGHAGNYHPFTWLSLMLDRTLWGFSPASFHTTNLVLHSINAALLLILLRAATGSTWRSVLAAALFALHPLRVESVAWATERKDVLSMFFALCAMGAYVWYAQAPKLARYLIVALILECALLSKSTTVTLPAIFLLLDFWPLRRLRLEASDTQPLKRSVRQLLLEKAPLVGLSALACVMTMIMQSATGTLGSFEKYPLAARLANVLAAYMRYIRKMFVPIDLAVFYPNHQNTTAWMVAISAITLAAVTALALRRRTRWPWLTVGWLWFCGAMIPMIGLVQSGAQSMADRFTYIPMMGLVIVAAWAVPQGWFDDLRKRATLATVVAALLIAMSIGTRRQISYWQNSETLFAHALAVTRDNHVAHNNLAFELSQQRRYDEARGHYLAALAIHPTYSVAHNGLGAVLARTGDLNGAMREYELAVKYNPGYVVAHRNLGLQLAAVGRMDDAIAHYTRCVELRPDEAANQGLLGLALAQQGRLTEAVVHFQAAADADPNNAQAQVNVGHVLLELKRPAEALAAMRQATALDAKLGEAHFHAGTALAQLGNFSAAAREFDAVLKLDPGDVAAQQALQQILSRPQQRTASVAE